MGQLKAGFENGPTTQKDKNQKSIDKLENQLSVLGC
jgi:hypothetical protein